jgi:hypothetical protein
MYETETKRKRERERERNVLTMLTSLQIKKDFEKKQGGLGHGSRSRALA